MQKAFDKVNSVVLFKKLISRDIPLHMIRLLFDFYYMLSLSVLWNGCMSKQFISYNGIKQGGVLSPILFCIYIDDLLIGLEKQGYGCFIGKLFYGVLAYADDIILLAPSLSALRVMLDFCSNYAVLHNITFNAMKSYCIRFSLHDISVEQFTALLQGARLTWLKKIKHLGHTLLASLNDSEDIICKQNDFTFQFNYFTSRFRNVSISLKIHLFKNFCYSFFGSQLWDLQHRSISQFDILWRKAVRRLWHIPYTTHCNLIPVFAFGKNFVLLFITDLLISRVIVLVVIKYILNLLRFLLLGRKCMFLVKIYFICHI